MGTRTASLAPATPDSSSIPSETHSQYGAPEVLQRRNAMFIPVALPERILVSDHAFDIAAGSRSRVLAKQHGECAVLFDPLLEHDIHGGSVVRRLGQDAAAFGRKDVGVKRYHAATGDVREPGEPSLAHAVPQMQRLELARADKAVDPTDRRRLERIGFDVILENQHALQAQVQRLLRQCLVRLITTLYRVIAALGQVKGHLVSNQAANGLVEQLPSVVPLFEGNAVNGIYIELDLAHHTLPLNTNRSPVWHSRKGAILRALHCHYKATNQRPPSWRNRFYAI